MFERGLDCRLAGLRVRMQRFDELMMRHLLGQEFWCMLFTTFARPYCVAWPGREFADEEHWRSLLVEATNG